MLTPRNLTHSLINESSLKLKLQMQTYTATGAAIQ
jgi:hypothetical protein